MFSRRERNDGDRNKSFRGRLLWSISWNYGLTTLSTLWFFYFLYSSPKPVIRNSLGRDEIFLDYTYQPATFTAAEGGGSSRCRGILAYLIVLLSGIGLDSFQTEISSCMVLGSNCGW